MEMPAASSPDMSPKTREILKRAREMVPPLLESFHKGQLGRIAVIGGSENYTGAPYFSAMASARLGCDMSHVICTPAAGAVIKTYSPNLMVHPLMRQSPPSSTSAAQSSLPSAEDVAKTIVTDLLPRLHVLVVGPGLGRDPPMMATAKLVLQAAREKGIPVVMDADALQIVNADPGAVKGWAECVLTPNVVEFGRLCKAVSLEQEAQEQDSEKRVKKLAEALAGPVVVEKGRVDRVATAEEVTEMDLQGGRKRSGGQGDTLTGAIATFLGWRKAYHDGLWEVSGEKMSREETMRLAVLAGAAITRECSRLAFAKRGRSLQASDLTDEVYNAFMNLFGEVDGAEGAKL